MPSIPAAASASLTSSSLNGLMMATMSFMRVHRCAPRPPHAQAIVPQREAEAQPKTRDAPARPRVERTAGDLGANGGYPFSETLEHACAHAMRGKGAEKPADSV